MPVFISSNINLLFLKSVKHCTTVKLMFANAKLTFVIFFLCLSLSGVSWTAKRFDVTGKASFIFFTGKNTALKKLDQFDSKYWLFLFGMFLSCWFIEIDNYILRVNSIHIEFFVIASKNKIQENSL